MKKIKILSVFMMLGLMMASAQTVSVGNVAMNTNEPANIDVKLTGGSTYIAMGFSVELPDGFSFTGDVTNSTDSHVIRVLQQDATTTKVAVYSSQNLPFESNDFTLLSLQVNGGTKSGSYQGRITGIEFASASHALVTKSDVTFTITVSTSSVDLDGDVNGDGVVGIGDIVAVTNVMAGIAVGISIQTRADVNHDGLVGIGDIVAIMNIMAGIKDDNKTPEGVEAVDLGLPSGTKWANMNIGASSPEEYGGYFAWGESEAKENFTWDTYQYGSSDADIANLGFNIAGTYYDAATANWGTRWRMPTLEQYNELTSNCSSVWTTQNGKNGRKFTGPNGNTIFLPAAGYYFNTDNYYNGSVCTYWLSELNQGSIQNYPYYMMLSSGGVGSVSDVSGYVGLVVRPVQNK